jgi:CheY-like chemotaxis protein
MTNAGFTILLVEDDPNDIFLMERAFAKLGYGASLKAVKDGEEAVDYLAGRGSYQDRGAHPLPGLVLLDLKLPKLSGFEVLAWMRRQPQFTNLPVGVLTSSKEKGDIYRAYSLGATSYMVKPTGFDDLQSMVKAIATYWLLLNKFPDS